MARGKKRSRSKWLLWAALLVLGLIGAFYAKGLLTKTITELQYPLRHEDVIRQQASKKGLDPALIAAVIYSESKFRPRRSHAGAVGLMQILPGTAKYIANKSGGTAFELNDLAEPQINIAYGSWYLKYLVRNFGGDTTMAVAAYNAGEHNVERWLHQGKVPASASAEAIPFPETRAYVNKVLKAQKVYRRKYAHELGYR